ncbi:MAG: DPP IV N-terminal domain-containing protein [Sphingorhabdus sp.]
MATSNPATAQESAELSLERVFASPSINGPSPRMVKLSPDGKYLTSLRPRPDDKDRFDLWFLDTASGKWKMLVDSTKLGTSGEISEAEKMQRERARIGGTKGIVAYDWSPDSRSLLVPIDGDLFLADLKGKVTRLTETPTSELDATVSPLGRYVSFVRDQNLVVAELPNGGSEVALSEDGGGTLSYGVAEFVAQEEMDRTRGHWWAADESAIAFARVDESGVKVATRTAIGAEGARVFEQRYAFAGTDNAKVDLFVWHAKGRKAVQVDLGANPDYYLARVDWMPDNKTLIVQRQSRDQKMLDVLKVDGATGASSVVFSETAKSWVNLHDNFREVDQDSLLWTSERDGFSHIYLNRKDQWTQLTSGLWSVNKIVGFDKKSGAIYFTGNRDDATEQHLYRVNIKGGEVERLTAPGAWHEATMNKAASRAIIRRAAPNQPEQVYLADANGKRLAWIEENAVQGDHPYAPFAKDHVMPTFGSIKAEDGTELKTKLLLPKMEPGKRYPVFVQVYGGPGAGRQVTKNWGGGALHQYLVDRGWIVFSVDNRGTPDRGKAFEDHIYRAMGRVEVADQLAGVEWLKSQPYVDPKRIAVYGWSYGGYMTLKLLQAAPGTFAAGVSGAPVTKWELYDTHYTERYMGDPRRVPEAYEKANVVPHAGKIADPLLLIHGMADDNVVFDHSTALMASMQGNAQKFETMVYPGQTHRVAGPKVSVHLWKTILAFLDRNMKNKED